VWTVEQVLEALGSDDHEKRVEFASAYPLLVTASREDILRAALSIVSADQMERALGGTVLDEPLLLAGPAQRRKAIRHKAGRSVTARGRKTTRIKKDEVAVVPVAEVLEAFRDVGNDPELEKIFDEIELEQEVHG